jgi:hypothetical protein
MFVNSLVSQRCYTGLEIYELCLAVTAAGGHFRFHADGFSMAPALPGGTVVVLRGLSATPPLGAVVLALVDGSVVLHRVLWRNAGHVLLAGDANRYVDGWIDRRFLAGIVIEWQTAGRTTSVTAALSLRGWLQALLRHGRRMFLNRR